MTLGIIFKRLRREWRLLAILLFAVSLITGFFALGPLYIRSVTEADLRYALDNTDPDALLLSVESNIPLTAAEQETIEAELPGLVVDAERYVRASYSPPNPAANQAGAGGAAAITVCGFNFVLGVNPYQGVGGTNNCYQPFAFESLEGKVTILEGRLPQRGPTPAMVDATGLTDEQQQELQLGIYNRGEVEAIVTDVVAEEAGLEVGSRFFIGFLNLQGGGALSRVKIVGIVQIVDPSDPFWSGNQMFLQGATVDVTNFTQRYDYGLAFHPAAYEDWVAPVLPQGVRTSYIWQMDVDTGILTSTNAADYHERLQALSGRLSTTGNQVLVTTEMAALLGRFGGRISDAEGPVILLSAAVLMMMLYHLVTTVSLVLQEQGKEWSTITSRGGSTFQLFKLQSITVIVLGVIALIIGPLLSRGFMLFMERSGPLAQALDGIRISDIAAPQLSYILSVAATIACVAALSVPAIPAARRSLLMLKQATSRPPTRPAWAQYWLDLLFIFLGLVLIFRLYWTVSGDQGFSHLINELLTAPDKVVKLVADEASDTGLRDPFNILAPVLLLTGLALLWLRFFPMMVRFISRYTSRSNRLTTPLAVWNVERDPGHYAQLVLLLIGTLALGTASLGLSETRNVGGWRDARMETGGAARVDLDLTQGRYGDTNWESLNGVADSTPVMYLTGQTVRDQRSGTVNVVGIDVADFVEAFPEFADEIMGLEGNLIPPSGISIPDDATQLQVQVWSESIAGADVPEAAVVLRAYLLDANNVPFVVEMVQPTTGGDASSVSTQQPPIQATTVRQPTPPEQWVTLAGQIPASATAPLRMWRVGIATEQGDIDTFSHTIYLDYWQTVNVEGTATPVNNQEDAALWQLAISELPYPGDWMIPSGRRISGLDAPQFVGTADNAPVFDGDLALQLSYRINRAAGNSTHEPSLGIGQVQIERIPAVVSQAFANDFKQNTARLSTTTRALSIGDPRDIAINFPVGMADMGLEVVNIIEEFPLVGKQDNQYFIILPIHNLQLLTNQSLLGGLTRYADANQTWLELEEQEPTETLKSELRGIESASTVTYAWESYTEILREPLPSAVAGMLFAGFWVSLILSLLDFAFYIAVTAKQRSFSFGVLRSLGWDANNIWRMLLVEQITLVTPALLIGSILGAGLAYLLLPFLQLVGGVKLQMPMLGVVGMIVILISGFTILLVFTAIWLRRMSVNQVLRLGEE